MQVLHISNGFCRSKVHANLCRTLDELGIGQVVYCPVRYEAQVGKNRFEGKNITFVYSYCIRSWYKYAYQSWASSGRLAVLSKGKWYHVKIYVKEGYQISALPVTKVWIDSKLVLESITPNCYKYNPSVKDSYNYLKFGIYKSPWMKSNVVPQTDRRIYFFDNYVVRY